MISAIYADASNTTYYFTMANGSGGTNHPDGARWQHYEDMRIAAGVTIDSYVPESNDPIITFEAFESRFTVQEWDDVTDFVYEADTITGKPKRRALIQGLSRAMAKNKVDLLHAKTIVFMDILVSGGVITEAKKDIILTP